MKEYLALLDQAETKYGLPKGLLHAQMQAESNGNPNAVSPKGARGLMQFMPATAKELGIDPNNPTQAIDGAGRYMKTLIDQTGNVDDAVGAYNWGIGNVKRKGMANAPKETRDYVAKVTSKIQPQEDLNALWEQASPDEDLNALWDSAQPDTQEPAKPQLAKSKKEYSNNPFNADFYNDMSLSNVPQNLANLVAGAVRGAGSIGATILSPADMINAAVRGEGLTGARGRNEGRRTGMDEGLQAMGADPNGGLYKTGKIGAEIAGTADLGGVMAAGTKALGAAPNVQNLLRSSGFSNGGKAAKVLSADTAARAAAGATVAGAQGLVIDPENAASYAMVGGGLPAGIRAAGAAGAATRNAVTGTVKNVIGATTGAGAEAIGGAYQAGKKGATAYVDNVKGNVAFDDVVAQEREGLKKMYVDKSELYRSGMVDISKDKTIISFEPIEKAVKQIGGMGSYKGVQINKNASGVVDDLMEKVNECKSLNPAEYHTP